NAGWDRCQRKSRVPYRVREAAKPGAPRRPGFLIRIVWPRACLKSTLANFASAPAANAVVPCRTAIFQLGRALRSAVTIGMRRTSGPETASRPLLDIPRSQGTVISARVFFEGQVNGICTQVVIAGKKADVFDPPRPRFGVLFLHGHGLETLRDRPAF